ncbi:MAG: flagellar hook-basal body complex protein [Clostridium sp.]
MLRTIWTSKAGMNANQTKLDSISNNIANSTTTGYKKLETSFKDLYSESLDRLGYPVNNRDAVIGTGVKTTDWYRNTAQGNILQTLRPMDLAIDGEGFMRLTTPDGGYVYTRDGNFQIDRMGRLVDPFGNKLELEYVNGRNEGNVKFTTNNFLIDTAGKVYIKEGETFNHVANVPLYTAVGDQAFLSAGGNKYVTAPGVEVYRATDYNVLQGALEGSNVDIGQEFTDMIITQRAFQLSSKALQTSDEMWGMINNMRR